MHCHVGNLLAEVILILMSAERRLSWKLWSKLQRCELGDVELTFEMVGCYVASPKVGRQPNGGIGVLLHLTTHVDCTTHVDLMFAAT